MTNITEEEKQIIKFIESKLDQANLNDLRDLNIDNKYYKILKLILDGELYIHERCITSDKLVFSCYDI